MSKQLRSDMFRTSHFVLYKEVSFSSEVNMYCVLYVKGQTASQLC